MRSDVGKADRKRDGDVSIGASRTRREPSWLTRHIPVTTWLPRYRRTWISRDVIAGFTTWGLLIPEGIAYATLAGLPPQAGLYTLVASLAIYAIFGTSRHLVVAGTSASAVLVYSAITALHPTSAASFATLAAGMIIITGCIFALAGICKLGFVTSFLSRPVMEGFVFGLAIFVTVKQLPKLFGIEKGSGDTVRQLVHVVAHFGQTSGITLSVGLVALGLLFGLERSLPRIPSGLVVLALGIAISAVLHLDHHGVDTVGSIPSGLPSPKWPHLKLSELWVLIPSAAGMMLVIFSESLGAGQAFAEKHGYRLESNQELVALGLANIGSGMLGGLACGGSLSQSAVNEGAGARSEVSPMVAATLSLVTVVALTPLFTDLPEAVLAALIIHAVSHLMKVREMRRFYRLMPRDFWLGMMSLLGVVVLDVLPGLLLGVILSILLLVYRASRPPISVMGIDPDIPGGFLDMRRHSRACAVRGVLVIRPDAPLFYANAQTVRDAVEGLVDASEVPIHAVVLDLNANDDIDITSTENLEKLVEWLDGKRIVLGIAHLHGPAFSMAERSGLLGKLHEDHIFETTRDAVDWAKSHLPGAGDLRLQPGEEPL
ncbi:MAG TPA: SulP family inorganic anion transporter [Acidimicrobiales bacterium]|nr:SulP family inorganic anion transporter [Acidimicrobiales bacterium]